MLLQDFVYSMLLCVSRKSKSRSSGHLKKAFLPKGAKHRGMLFQLKKKVDNGITVVRCDNLLEIDFVKNRFFIAHTHDSYGVTGYAHETFDWI